MGKKNNVFSDIVFSARLFYLPGLSSKGRIVVLAESDSWKSFDIANSKYLKGAHAPSIFPPLTSIS